MRLIALNPLIAVGNTTGRPVHRRMALRNITGRVNTWNRGDASAIRSTSPPAALSPTSAAFFTGYPAFSAARGDLQRHFQEDHPESESRLTQFIRPTCAIVETVTPSPAATSAAWRNEDSKRRIRTRLMQVAMKSGGAWTIVAYHNVDVKPGTDFPYPR